MRWSLAATDVKKEHLAHAENISEIEKRIEYTDSWYHFFAPLEPTDLFIAFSLCHYWQLRHCDFIGDFVSEIGFACNDETAPKHDEMQKLAPEMKRIQEQYKNDRQTGAMKTMELYKKHKVNSCRWLFTNIYSNAYFLALYQTFRHSADMRGEGFLWIADLTQPDQLTYLFMMFGFPVTIDPLLIAYILAQFG